MSNIEAKFIVKLFFVFRLLDFTTLNVKKKQSDVYYVSKAPTKPKPKKAVPLIDILNEPEINETADSNSEVKHVQYSIK